MIPVGGLGDLIAICQVVAKIGIVLCDTRERPKDFAELEEELNSLYTILQGIKNLYDPSTSPDPSCIAGPLQKQVTECNAIMDDFMQKNTPPNKWYRKIIWALRESGRADSLRRKLNIQRLNLGLILQQFNVVTGNSQLSGLMTEVKEVRMEVRELHFRMRGIDFEDATGTTIVIPPEFCRSYETLLKMINLYYGDHIRQLPGRRLVLQGQYELVHGQNNATITSDLWDSLLSPGLVVKMSMILRRREDQGVRCPKCDEASLGEANNDWVLCSCGCIFSAKQRIVEEDEFEEQAEQRINSITDKNPLVSAGNITSNKGHHRESVNASVESVLRNEWKYFRLISVLTLRWKPQPDRSVISRPTTVAPVTLPAIRKLMQNGHNSSNIYKLLNPIQSPSPAQQRPITADDDKRPKPGFLHPSSAELPLDLSLDESKAQPVRGNLSSASGTTPPIGNHHGILHGRRDFPGTILPPFPLPERTNIISIPSITTNTPSSQLQEQYQGNAPPIKPFLPESDSGALDQFRTNFSSFDFFSNNALAVELSPTSPTATGLTPPIPHPNVSPAPSNIPNVEESSDTGFLLANLNFAGRTAGHHARTDSSPSPAELLDQIRGGGRLSGEYGAGASGMGVAPSALHSASAPQEYDFQAYFNGIESATTTSYPLPLQTDASYFASQTYPVFPTGQLNIVTTGGIAPNGMTWGVQTTAYSNLPPTLGVPVPHLSPAISPSQLHSYQPRQMPSNLASPS